MEMKKLMSVKNRSAGIVVYRIPEHGIRREFVANETKKITYEELVWLSFRPGGRELMQNYLQIQDAEATKDLNIRVEPEYKMGEEDVVHLLLNGSLDELLDALDFAPAGVIDIIKAKAVELPLQDMQKREAIQKATGFNVTAAIQFNAPDPDEEEVKTEEKPTRRVAKAEAPTRRVEQPTESKYTIIE